MTIIFMLVLLEDCRTVSRLDSSPTNTSPRTDPQLKNFAFFSETFCWNFLLDFPLIFSWFIILPIHFIYTQLIYKRFNLLNIASQCSAIILS